ESAAATRLQKSYLNISNFDSPFIQCTNSLCHSVPSIPVSGGLRLLNRLETFLSEQKVTVPLDKTNRELEISPLIRQL
ncbi:hypothetical protein K0M31_015408, partial [Melipona bicolor]